MQNLRKRKTKPTAFKRPSKKSKPNYDAPPAPVVEVESFLDDSDVDEENESHSSQNIDDIINQAIADDQDMKADEFLDAGQEEEDEEVDVDLATKYANEKYNELDEFHADEFDLNDNDDEEQAAERDEFDELAIASKNDDHDEEEDDFLGLGGDDDEEEDEGLHRLASLEDARKKQIEADVKQDMYEEKQLNDSMRAKEFVFAFPSYKRLLKEKKEAPKLNELKQRIESVLEVLSNFRVLRDSKHSRKEYISLLSHSMSRYYGYNLDLMNMFLTLFNPNECLAFLEANEQSRPLTLRTNTLKCRRRDLAKLLIERGLNIDPLAKWSKTGLKVNNGNTASIPIGATPEYLSGYYMIQSAASLLPTLALDIKGKHKVLDMCSAPGGKTTHIAQLLRETGVIVANDVNHERLKAVYGNVHRMGLKNVVVCNLDARQLPSHFHPIFDRVLLDAPCSCLGVIARDPSIKLSKKFNDVIKMSALQKELILSAIDCCKVGGYVVYSTCSISPYENESVVEHAVEKRFVKLVDTGLPFGEPGFTKFKHLRFHCDMNKTRRYYPHIHNLDGFYVAKLWKCDQGIRRPNHQHTSSIAHADDAAKK